MPQRAQKRAGSAACKREKGLSRLPAIPLDDVDGGVADACHRKSDDIGFADQAVQEAHGFLLAAVVMKEGRAGRFRRVAQAGERRCRTADIEKREVERTLARIFGDASVRISGRGRNAVLAAPYAPVMTFSNAEGRTARQLMDDVLTVNGVPLGWSADWALTDWNVPAGAFAHQGTWIEALAAIARDPLAPIFSQVTFAFTVTPGLLVTGLVYSLILGLVGGLLPGLRAARLPVTAGLREL